MLQVQEVEPFKLNVVFTADEDLVKQTKSKAVNFFNRQKVRVPGFRPGKANQEAVFHYLKDQAKHFVSQELLNHAHQQLLFQENIKTLFSPEVNQSHLKGNTFWCEFNVTKKPTVTLNQYKGFDIPKPATDSVNDLAAKMLQELRENHGEVQPFEDSDTVQLRDKITLDLVCTVNDQEKEDYTKRGLMYVVGQSQVLPQLDEALIGLKPGESAKFTITEEDGSVLNFEATVHMGLKHMSAPLDDTLAAKLGLDSLSKLQEKVNGIASNTLEAEKTQKIQQQLFNRLLDLHDFEMPQFLIDLEAANMAKQLGSDISKLDEEKTKSLKENAKKSVKLSLLLDAVREEEAELTFSDKELLDILASMMQQHGQDPNVLMNQMMNDGSILGAIANIKDKLTIDWLVKQSNIIE